MKKLSALFISYRTQMTKMLSERKIIFHTRVPEMLACLKVGFDILLDYLCDKGQIGSGDVISYRRTFDEILIENIRQSSGLVENESLSYQFCDKLTSLLDSGRCSLNSLGNNEDTSRKGFIGYADDSHYYLIMNAVMSEINRFSKEIGDGFAVGKTNLIKQLVEDRIIITNGKSNTTTVRVSPTVQKNVAVLDRKEIERRLYGSVCREFIDIGETDG